MNPNRRDGMDLETLSSKALATRPSSSASADTRASNDKKQMTKKKIQIKVWIGRLLMLLIGGGSIYMVIAISLTSESANSWPWGFWYVFALLFDLAFFQPIMSLAKFLLFLRHLKKPFEGRFKGLCRSIIGNDILAVVESKVSLASK